MTCEDVLDRLDDYVDGELGEAQYQEIELHLGACSSCRAEERGLRRLLAEAEALPGRVLPPRDLWPGIAERLGPGRSFRSRVVRPWVLGPLLAAAAVLTVSVSVLVRSPAPPGGPAGASRPGPGSSLAPGGTLLPAGVGLGLERAEREYTEAAAELLVALDARRDTLPPETLRVVDENLRIIDQALADLRAALGRDPGNPNLAGMLRATHQKKIQVLRRMARIT